MVKRWLMLAALALAPTAQAEAVRFVAEYAKNPVYEGELFTVSFVIYAQSDRIDLEVAKFPEFRGFWSENLALRQGPLLLLPDARAFPARRAVVGTYQTVAMRGSQASVILPMQAVARVMTFQGQQELSIESETPKLTIRPLPPVPPTLRAGFTGAVGSFNFRAEASGLRYTPGDPVSVRYYVTGQGNLPEVNRLSPVLPEGVALLAQRNASLSGPFQNKTFELTLTTDREDEFEIPALEFVYFSPASGKYESVQASAVQMVPVKRPPEPLTAEKLDLGPVAKTWSASKPLSQSFGFWLVNAALALIWVGLATRQFTSWNQARLASDPRHQLRQAWKQLLHPKDVDSTWVERAEALLFRTLDARSPRPLTTRRQAAAFAKKQWGEAVSDPVARFFSEWENAHYRPERGPLPEPGPTREMLRSLRRPLLSRKPRWRTRHAS